MSDHRESSAGPEQSAKCNRSTHAGKGGRSTRSQLKPQWRGKDGGRPSDRPWKRYPRTAGGFERGWVEGRSSHQRQGPANRSTSQEGQQENKPPANTPPKPQLKEGKKKASLSLNHLLNFTIASSSGDPEWGGHPSWRVHKHRPLHHFSKEQFLQANCQFVVRDGNEYSLHLTDPDTLVDWEQVEQVRLFCNEMPSCPICLDQPRVAKITHCGHVFCWSCILHYLALSDHSWRKCPICFESVHRDSLKSVVALSSPVYHVGDTVTMRLMVRTKGGTAVLPKSQWTQESGRELLSVKSDKATRFVKLLTATAMEVLESITSVEKAALQHQLSSLTADEESERMFVEGALVQLQEREEQLMKSVQVTEEVDRLIAAHTGVLGAMGSMPNQSPRVEEEEEGEELWGTWDTEAVVETCYQAAFSDSDQDEEDDRGTGSSTSTGSSEEGGRREVEGCLPPPDSLQPTLRSSDEGGSPSEGDLTEPAVVVVKKGSDSYLSQGKEALAPELVYFFQATDGQHLYLHPINARCLMKEYGSLEYAPQEITARIVDMEQHSITKEGRSRFRYLSHLPLTCQIVLCELNLGPPLLSLATLGEFADGLRWRKEKRAKKRREEQGHGRHIAHRHVESRNGHHEWLGTPPKQSHNLLSLDSSPPLPSLAATRQSDDSASVSSPQPQPPQLQEGGPQPPQLQEGEPQEATVHTPPQSSVSFAAALKCPNKAAPPPMWLGRESAKKKLSNPIAPKSGGDVEGEGEGPIVPSFQDAFGDALAIALERVQPVPTAAHTKIEGPSKAGKKGRKKTVLFTTGNMRRGT